VGQAREPLAQQSVDLRRVQAIAQALQRLGVRARPHPVVERLERDPAPAQLALGVLVAVQQSLAL